MNQGDPNKKSFNNPGPPSQFKGGWNINGGNFLAPKAPAGGHMNLNLSSSSGAPPVFKGVNRGGAGTTFLAPRSNWKGRNKSEKRKRKAADMTAGLAGPGPATSQVRAYEPPRLQELQKQNRLKSRRFYSKKKFNDRAAPYAPRNTTSYIIRAKKSGGIASLVSPCPVTPAILPTPIISPAREGLMDMAKQEWGLDGYGTMKGFIRLRDDGNGFEGENREDYTSTSESDVEEHAEMERRVDHDLSRFVMTYPSTSSPPRGASASGPRMLETRVDDQENQIARLEEENLTLKERLFLMEQEMEGLRRRLQNLESGNPSNNAVIDNNNSNVIDNNATDDDAAEVCSEKSVEGRDGEADGEQNGDAEGRDGEADGEHNGDLEGRDGKADGDGKRDTPLDGERDMPVDGERDMPLDGKIGAGD